ncbi:MAG: AraC family transcriptional regulator [Chitinophagaceae bacterium]|nr:MAG: AraC family transcriptional regulator [Chitinophagaceae bacterium]
MASAQKPYHIGTVARQHELLGLGKPRHPLITVFPHNTVKYDELVKLQAFTLGFYCIAVKTDFDGKLRYGQGFYDFDKGIMSFISPGQLLKKMDVGSAPAGGYSLIIHPDFINGSVLADKMNGYGFFAYEINEALHLSETERVAVEEIFVSIEREYNTADDSFSKDIIIAQIDLLLQYSNRFYVRQFKTREAANDGILMRMEKILLEYFSDKTPEGARIPTVQDVAARLNISPGYLSDMLRSVTGQTAQEHIHYRLIEKAKSLLSATDLQVSEVAYQLGFDYPQSFHKLFKNKTKMSPLEFRKLSN